MIEAGELFVNAIEHWREAKGTGTALIPSPLDDKLMVLGVLQRVYTRSPTCKTVIITKNFNERRDVIDFLTQQPNDDENNQEFKKLINNRCIQILTLSFIEEKDPHLIPFLCVVYRPDRMCPQLVALLNLSKFKLVVLNRLLSDAEDMTTLYKIAPILDDFKANEVEQARLSTPVEEIQIPVDIPADSETAKLLNYYTKYINTSIAIFGSLEVMQQANTGNRALNISSTQICADIAEENGWNEHLDMSVEFNIEIDKLYNPMNLKERASKTYEIIRNRSQLLSDFKDKIPAILKIVDDNPDKKILIINKRGEFATEVTDYINNLSDRIVCLNYHDKVSPIPATDLNGNPIFYKSGANKGERKFMAAQAQKSYAEKMFNAGKINVLSTNNSPDKDLNIDVDVVIISSPFCENITSYIYRLANVQFNTTKLILYSIYCRSTTEQKQLEHKQLALNHNVKNYLTDDEICDFVVAD